MQGKGGARENLDIFKKKYTLRQFGKAAVDGDGYANMPYEDRPVSLNVQPLTVKELEILPEGSRSKKRVKSFGDFPIRTAEQEKGFMADRLFYDGKWYECESSSNWGHIMLAHYESQFVQVTESEFPEDILAPVTGNEANVDVGAETGHNGHNWPEDGSGPEEAETEITDEPSIAVKKGLGKTKGEAGKTKGEAGKTKGGASKK